MGLDREMQVFQRELPRMLREHRGQFVLIQGDHVDSFWQSDDAAYAAGCQCFGPEPFLVMHVVEDEPPIPLLYQAVPRCPAP